MFGMLFPTMSTVPTMLDEPGYLFIANRLLMDSLILLRN